MTRSARSVLATLAPILVVVASHMSEWRTFVSEFRAPKSDVAVLLTTFLLTVWREKADATKAGCSVSPVQRGLTPIRRPQSTGS